MNSDDKVLFSCGAHGKIFPSNVERHTKRVEIQFDLAGFPAARRVSELPIVTSKHTARQQSE
jgi:hypothetical protein